MKKETVTSGCHTHGLMCTHTRAYTNTSAHTIPSLHRIPQHWEAEELLFTYVFPCAHKDRICDERVSESNPHKGWRE